MELEITPDAIEVALPIEVTTPVRLAFMSTVVTKELVPVPDTPPVKVIVWSPVLVPEFNPVTSEVNAKILEVPAKSLIVKVAFPIVCEAKATVISFPFVRSRGEAADVASEVAEATPKFGVTKVIPESVKAAEVRFKATEVVPINVEEELAELSPVLTPL